MNLETKRIMAQANLAAKEKVGAVAEENQVKSFKNQREQKEQRKQQEKTTLAEGALDFQEELLSQSTLKGRSSRLLESSPQRQNLLLKKQILSPSFSSDQRKSERTY
jgi:hypothetical protein